jgi:hypothetical protein
MFENLGRTLRPDQTLKLRCDACGHPAAFDRETAFKLFDPDASPFEVRRRSRCRHCEASGLVRVWI